MQSKVCQNCKKDFILEPDDFAFYEKLKVPPPTWCPHCRFIRKLTFINERSLYKRICYLCKAPIISMYSSDVPLPVLCIKCNLSDDWDAQNYGRDYDFSKTFFEQFKLLKYSVPHRALDQNERNGPGCEYANLCYTSKDIYLSFDVIGSEYIKYSSHVLKNNKNCMDSMVIKDNDLCYELVHASTNYNSSFLVESDRCVDSSFLYDCSNCTNCCLSSNLRNKSYVFNNRQLSKEEYQNAIHELRLETYSGQQNAKNAFKQMADKAIHRYANIKNSVNVVGDFIGNAKNMYHCYCLVGGENVKYAYFGGGVPMDSQDLIMTGRIEECYEFTLGGRGASRVVLSLSCAGGCKNLFYCDICRGCSDCFGCVGLKEKQYCILNKQYTKEEYFELIEKIKTHMSDMPYIDVKGRKYGFGECFPTEISPFAYNETIAYEENPMSKEEITASGYRWKDMELKSYTPTITGAGIPDSIRDAGDDITQEIIECPNRGKIETQCTSAYRILPDELSFYRQMNLPVPRYCPNCRYHERLKWKNSFRFYKRECMCTLPAHNHETNPRQGGARCPNEFETMYPPGRPEIIYCKECYQAEVY